MTDPAAPPPEPTPIVIDPSVVRTLLLNLSLALGIVVTTVTTLAGFVSNRDLAGWIVWIKSEDFVQFVGAVGLLVSLGAFVLRSLRRKWREVYLGKLVDNRYAIVKAPTAIPGEVVDRTGNPYN